MPDLFDGRPVIGVDIGGTGLKVGLISRTDPPAILGVDVLEGHAREKPARAMERLAGSILALLDANAVDRPAVSAVGVGCAGLVDREKGVLHVSPNLPAWKDVPIGPELSRRLGCPVTLVNDAQAFLAAEWLAGAARGAANALFVTLGTGVGGGLVLNGRPFRGSTGLGGEVGHMSVDLEGPECACGNRGCLELYVGRGGFERMAHQAGLDDDGAATPARLAERAAAGEAKAVKIFDEVGRRLGVALAGLVNLLEPEVIVLGGGIASAGDLVFEPALREMTLRSMVARQRTVALKPAAFGPRAGMVGAALIAAAPEVFDQD